MSQKSIKALRKFSRETGVSEKIARNIWHKARPQSRYEARQEIRNYFAGNKHSEN